MRSDPLLLGITTMELTHGVGCVTEAIILWCAKLSKVCCSWSLNATGTRLGACCTGCTSGSTLMWYSPSSRPTPSLNTSGCFTISSSLDTGMVLLTACTVASRVSGLLINRIIISVRDQVHAQASLSSKQRADLVTVNQFAVQLALVVSTPDTHRHEHHTNYW